MVVYYLRVLALSWLAKIALISLDFGLGLLGGAVVHLYAGYRLNRRVLTRVTWHHQHNTVDKIAAVKLRALMFWPLVYPVFFVKLWIVRHL